MGAEWAQGCRLPQGAVLVQEAGGVIGSGAHGVAVLLGSLGADVAVGVCAQEAYWLLPGRGVGVRGRCSKPAPLRRPGAVVACRIFTNCTTAFTPSWRSPWVTEVRGLTSLGDSPEEGGTPQI